MAEQQITIDYTVAASKNGRQPAIDVHLVLTYDDAEKRTYAEKQNGTYKVDSASGTYTTTVKKDLVTYTINGLKGLHHIGNNDNRITPSATTLHGLLDQHGISYTLSDPLNERPRHEKLVNLFRNPEKSGDVQQYAAFKSRTLTTFTLSGPTPVASTSTTTESDAVVSPDCFAAGTLIRTARGDVAVEALEVGDRALTATGALRPITWLGRRELDLRARPAEMQPVRIAAHAFDLGMPARDLMVSPGHPVLVGADADNEGGVLVPIMCLINGTTIRRVAVDTIAYWHVELDGHDILLAEGLPAESFIAFGDRTFFTHGADSPLANPDLVLPGIAGRCRPVAIDGALVEAERDRLDAVFATRLADACAWPGAEALSAF